MMKSLTCVVLLVSAACCAAVVAEDPPAGREAPADPHRLAPPVHGAELVAQVRAASDRGFAFLLRTQNTDGSWGSHDPLIAGLKDFGFKTTNRGSQDGVRLACTAICAKALLAKPDRTPAETAALDRATAAVLDIVKFAYHRGEAFNTWGYGYCLDYIAAFLQDPRAQDQRPQALDAAAVCIKGLLRYQQADGGWNYYAGPTMGGESMSFNTAVFVIALHRAAAAGVEMPRGMAADATRLLQRMQTVRGGFVYDARFLLDPDSVNELSAGSRTAVCLLALHEVGAIDTARLARAMTVFDEGENYLEDGRKLIQPHTAVHQISGYFFFFGYDYITQVAERLGADVTPQRWERFAWTMVRTQEPGGEWWDTAAATYGDKWGTGFALQVLQRCLAHLDGAVEEGR